MTHIDLTRIPWARNLLRNRWPQFLLRAVTLAGFVFTILAGLFGSVVGSHNFAIIFVWIAWWTALKLFFIGGKIMAADDFIHRHESDIVPVVLILCAGISQSYDKPHGINH